MDKIDCTLLVSRMKTLFKTVVNPAVKPSHYLSQENMTILIKKKNIWRDRLRPEGRGDFFPSEHKQENVKIFIISF